MAEATALSRVIDAGCAQLRREKKLGECVRHLRVSLSCPAMPPRWRAAAWCQLLRDLQSDGHQLTCLRLAEMTHAADGQISAAAVTSAAGGSGVPTSQPLQPLSAVTGGDVPSTVSSMSAALPTASSAAAEKVALRLSRYQLLQVRHPWQVPRRPSPFLAGAMAVLAIFGSWTHSLWSSGRLLSCHVWQVRRLLLRLAVPPRRWKKPKVAELRQATEKRIAAPTVALASRRAGWLGARPLLLDYTLPSHHSTFRLPSCHTPCAPILNASAWLPERWIVVA